MIDFACKKFSLDEIIKCSLGLTKSDLRILEFLMKNREKINSNGISEKLDLELSTVQRSLKRLNEKNMLLRHQINLSNGGYVYYYTINDKKVIRKIILDIIQNWTKKVEMELEKI
ncbi:MAG: HTH domain-containing protein [Candidatus Pacearchaeota archaeon]|jgi:predicted transcriptional regulator